MACWDGGFSPELIEWLNDLANVVNDLADSDVGVRAKHLRRLAMDQGGDVVFAADEDAVTDCQPLRKPGRLSKENAGPPQ